MMFSREADITAHQSLSRGEEVQVNIVVTNISGE